MTTSPLTVISVPCPLEPSQRTISSRSSNDTTVPISSTIPVNIRQQVDDDRITSTCLVVMEENPATGCIAAIKKMANKMSKVKWIIIFFDFPILFLVRFLFRRFTEADLLNEIPACVDSA